MRNARRQVPPAPSPSPTTDVLRPIACGDPVRSLLYERVGRYFYDPATDVAVEGVCSLCGAQTEGNLNSSTNSPDCAPRRSLTKERRRVLAGAPISHSSPLKPDSLKNKMAGVGGLAMVEVASGLTYVLTNVVPIAPLPDTMTALPVVPGSTNAFWRDFLARMPAPPFLIVAWGQKASVPLVLTHTLSRVFVCGSDNPVVVDIVAVRAAVRTIERMGLSKFKEACSLRGAYARIRTEEAMDAFRERFDALDSPEVTLSTLGSFPLTDSEEFALALRAAGLQGTESDVDPTSVSNGDVAA